MTFRWNYKACLDVYINDYLYVTCLTEKYVMWWFSIIAPIIDYLHQQVGEGVPGHDPTHFHENILMK